MNALDLSTPSRATSEWCQARIAEGYELLIVCLWTGGSAPAGASDALRLWRQAGGLTAGYFVVHDCRPAQEHFERARRNAGSGWDNLSFIAVDVEHIDEVAAALGGYTATMATVIEACSLVPRPVVYTSAAEWSRALRDPGAIDQPLWLARYDGLPDLSMQPFAGRTACVGHQYQGDVTLDGVQVDLSVFDDDFVPAARPLSRSWPTRARETANKGGQRMTDAERQVIEDVIGPLHSWARGHRLRAAAVREVGAGEPWQFTDPLDEREAGELEDLATRLEGLLRA